MSRRLKSFRIGAGVVAVLSAVAVAIALVAGNNTVVQTDAAATDSVNFSHEAEALTFYSNATVEHSYTENATTQPQVWQQRDTYRDGSAPSGRQPFTERHVSTAHSGSATTPTRTPAQITVGTGPGKYGFACASPHGASSTCGFTEHQGMPSGPATASTKNGVTEWLDWRRSGVFTTRVNAVVADAASGQTTPVGYEAGQTPPSRQGIATAAVCTPNGQGGVTIAGRQPYAVVRAGREDFLLTTTGLRVDVRNTSNLVSDNRVDHTPSTQNFRTANSGFQQHRMRFDTPLVDSDMDIEFTTEWGSDGDSAWSRIMLRYRGYYDGLFSDQYSPWVTYRASSECGVGDPPSVGAAGLGTMQHRAFSLPSPLEESLPATPAPPSRDPRETGFVEEDRVTVLSSPDREFHLLADDELDALRREEAVGVIDAVIDAVDSDDLTTYEGTVGLSEWALHPVDTRSHVPVIEIILSDGTTVQVRPIVDGVELPGPDVVVVETPTEISDETSTPTETETTAETEPEISTTTEPEEEAD